MQVRKLRQLSPENITSLFELWNAEYPVELQYESVDKFRIYLDSLHDTRHYLLETDDQKINGWAFDFEREDERWFGLIVRWEYQNKKFGSQLLDLLKENNKSLSGWAVDHDHYRKTDGSIYHSPIKFYLKRNFTIDPLIRLGFDKISAIKISWVAG